MDLLYYFIVNSVIILGDGTLVQKSTGNPSGSGNTTPDNTLALFFFFAFAYIRIHFSKFGTVPSYSQFMYDVGACLYGDDSLLLCTESCLEWFTGEAIVEAFSVFGVTLSPEGGTLEPQPLDQLSFLSSTFHFNTHYGMWVPVPHAEKIMSSLTFGGKTNSRAMSLYRAQSLLLVAFWNPVCNRILREYITFMHRTGSWLLDVDSTVSELDIMSTYRTDQEYIFMWLGVESDSGIRPERCSMPSECILNILHHAQQNDSSEETGK